MSVKTSVYFPKKRKTLLGNKGSGFIRSIYFDPSDKEICLGIDHLIEMKVLKDSKGHVIKSFSMFARHAIHEEAKKLAKQNEYLEKCFKSSKQEDHNNVANIKKIIRDRINKRESN